MKTSNHSIPTLKSGDIVRFISPTAGKLKWHLCLTPEVGGRAPRFLFINSKKKSDHDAVLVNEDFNCIPKTVDGISIVSFSLVLPVSMQSLSKFDAEVTGSISKETAEKLIKHSKNLAEPPLTNAEVRFVQFALGLIT